MDLLSKLAENGLLGLLLAISLSANLMLVKMILAEKDKRIATSEKTVDEVAQPLKNIQLTQELIYEKIKISKEASHET
jgi:hypothetical protein